MCFSDESTFQVLTDKKQYVKRRPGEKFNEDCVVKTIKYPPSVMIWSVISSKGLGRLYVVVGTMRQDQYITVLQRRLIPQLNEWFPNNEEKIFMQDSAPCHTAKSVKTFLAQSSIPLLEWPGNSPDLNPIENVWELLKREIGKENITTKHQLIARIIWHWNHNDKLKEKALNCVTSMPRRIESVIKAKGGITKY